jgi:hypothetical protein
MNARHQNLWEPLHKNAHGTRRAWPSANLCFWNDLPHTIFLNAFCSHLSIDGRFWASAVDFANSSLATGFIRRNCPGNKSSCRDGGSTRRSDSSDRSAD